MTLVQSKTIGATPAYTAPEIIKRQKITEKVDIWALGVILYQLVTCEHPFEEKNNFFAIITAIKEKPFKPLPAKTSTYMTELITKLLVKEPESRPNSKELLNDPEIKKYLVKVID